MDIQEFTARQASLLPPWFGDEFPILIAAIQGSAYCNQFIYTLSTFLRAQMRLPSMTGETLDLFAQDYFGNKLLRHFNEDDDTYRTRISATLLRPSATRPAMIQVLTDLTGRVPIVWESGIDSAFYNYSFCNHMNGGSNNDAYQAWIIAFRPLSPAQAGISYFNETAFCNHSFAAGSVSATVTDQDILDAIQQTKCEGTLMHVTILD
jgi:hypothetical protein